MPNTSSLHIESFITSLVQSRFGKMKIVLITALLSLCLHVPRYNFLYNYLRQHETSSKYDALALQTREPFVHHSYPVGSHEEKMDFRLFIPLLSKITHLNVLGLYLLQLVLLPVVYFLVLQFLLKLLQPAQAVAMLLAFSCIYTGQSYFLDVYGFYDSYAFAFIVFACFINNPVLCFVFCFFSLFVDERAYFSVFSLLFLEYLKESRVRITPRVGAIVLSVIAGMGMRVFLQAQFGLHLVSSNLLPVRTFLENMNNIGLALITEYKGFWLLMAVALFALLHTKKYLLALLLSGATVLYAASSMIVHDMTRSLGYMFTCIFISLLILSKQNRLSSSLVYVVLFFSLIIPTYMVQKEVYWVRPLYFEFLNYLFHS